VFQFCFLINVGDCAPVHQLEEFKKKKINPSFQTDKTNDLLFSKFEIITFS
jgi:hypothetical protein